MSTFETAPTDAALLQRAKTEFAELAEELRALLTDEQKMRLQLRLCSLSKVLFGTITPPRPEKRAFTSGRIGPGVQR